MFGLYVMMLFVAIMFATATLNGPIIVLIVCVVGGFFGTGGLMIAAGWLYQKTKVKYNDFVGV